VRRFNFFQYADYADNTLALQRNPDVTVRSRGVMEKCTYCVQRIRQASIQADKEGRPVRDGEILTACQAACPANAIVFGDINDLEARVTQLKKEPQNYLLLGELNTRCETRTRR
jgi:molybdopterin-containing oxidoreductase family iron-sulfur binding subunit